MLSGANISSDYFYGDLNVPISLEQLTDSPKRHATPGHVSKLEKGLYGTKLAEEI